MTNITNYSLIACHFKMSCFDNVFVSCSSDYNICFTCYIVHFTNLKTFHCCLQSADWVYFGNNYTSACSFERCRSSFSYIAITSYYYYFTSYHGVCCSSYSIYCTFSTAVFIIKFRFGYTVIYIDSGNR